MDRVQAFNGGEGDEKIGWEFHNVTLNRIHGFGFGIAVSGGRDNPHFLNGDPSIAISDVLKAGPAEGKLNVNDRVISANGISLENVDYTTAVQVLRECGSTVNLLIKRRVLLPSSDGLKVTLTKSRKKDDFGIVLGCRIFIKEITNKNVIEKEAGLQKGDAVLKINNTSTENLSLKDAKKLFEASKEKLHLVVKREHSIPSEDAKENALPETNGSMPRASRSNQNLYVQPPTRGDFSRHSQSDEKSNLTKMQHLNGNLPSSAQSTLLNQGYGRNRGPIVDISLSQLDKPATPLLSNTTRNGQEEKDDIPPRPPPPRPHTYGEEDPLVRRRHGGPLPDPRLISFQKDGSVGIRLTGGNEVGIFVTAVQPGSPASLQGLQPGDKLLKVNNMEMKGVTREDAVLYLLGVQDQVDLVVQYCKDAYDEIVANQKGDNFYIRTHFSYKTTAKGELDFHYGEVFRVVDTLFSGVVGSWLVYRVGRNGQEIQKGVIPNKSRAEELAAEQSAVEKSKKSDSFTTVTRGNFFKRRSARRSKSLNKDNWDDVVFADGLSKFGAYERVTLRHPGFIRPVVLFGALADVARDKILKDYPDKYASPQLDDNVDDLSKAQKSLGIVRLSAIREIVDKGKHCLLDITPNAVDRLNYAQFYPIVIFLRAENKSVVKELRSRSSSKSSSSSSKKSSRKLFEQSVKMEKLWSHVFTSTLTLTSADMWYKKLRETIERQQQSNIWMGEAKPEGIISDDFLFPMTSRLSYASSPESDLDLVHDPKGRDEGHSPRLVKASSDPSIATVEEVSCNSFGNLPPYTRSKQLPLHILLRKELTKTLTKTNGFPGKSDDLDREDHFGTSKDNYNSLYSVERYTGENDANKDSNLYESHTTAPKETGPEPPPRVDRHMKPNRFRTAHERLFGKSERRDVNSAPDYINTTLASTRTPNSSASKLPGVDHVRQGSRGSVLENGSYSGDSYKYISPSGTLDDRKYGSLTSANSNSTMRLPHDPYRYTRSTAQPLGMPGSKPADRNSKAFPTVPGQPPPFPMENGMRPAPPSPPPKPCNYPSMRLSDGRPVPPPKPFTYQTGRQPWRPDCEAETEVAFNGSQAPMINGTSNGGPYMPNNWNNVPNVDMSGGPPAYFPPTKDQLNGSSVMQSNGDMQPSYANHQAVSSPNRRMLYSDTDSSSGYMTGKSSYDMRSQYSSKTSSSRSSSMMNGNGPYLNVPYPPRHREASNGVPTFTSSPSNGLQPPMNLIDLSNRENRGSAFELYRKPGDSIPRTGYHYHSLAAPPPPPPAPMIPIHDSK